jgi:hypothetical protein
MKSSCRRFLRLAAETAARQLQSRSARHVKVMSALQRATQES